VAGEADHLAASSMILTGSPISELEHLALVGHRAGLEHEADRFRDRHEVTVISGSVT